jgi:hypothetical protein
VFVKRFLIISTALAAMLAPRNGAALPTKDECINANEAAQSLRTAGKLRAAEAKLAFCTATACPGPVRDDCTERLNEVQRALPTLVFDVRGTKGGDLVAVRVTMDGAVIASKVEGSPVAVDPGEHTFAFAAEGYPPFQESLVVREGEKARVVPVVLRKDGDARDDASAAASRGPDAAEGHGSAMRVGAVVALGVGVVGIGVGSVFGALAITDKNALDARCNGFQCPAYEQPDIDRLHSNGWISNVGFGVGIAGLATAAVLWLLSGSADAGPPRSGETSRGASKPAPFAGLRLTPWGLYGVFQ